MRKLKIRPLSGTESDRPRAYEAAHALIAREAACGGIVLLENRDGTLPLAPGSRAALFGAGAAKTVKGGTGSGDVNERRSVTIAEGLAEAGIRITTERWLEEYVRQYTASREAWRDRIREDAAQMKAEGNQNAFFDAYAVHQYKMPAGPDVYATETDTAIYVISRNAGENADRRAEEGDYYLSAEEHGALERLCALYPRVIVLLNSGGVIDLSFMDEFPAIQALLLVSQPGMEGGRAVADVLTGAVSPSGKLTATWACRFEDYPCIAACSPATPEEDRYEEGLYVGYRYFDSFRIPVRYGFGYGLSYTSFSLETESVRADGETVSVTVRVRNTGNRPGREVVQVYAALPDGRLEKEYRRLAAFAKTGTLAPGAEETLTLSFGAERLSCYDPEGSAWILEKGTTGLFVGNSLASSVLAAALVLAEDRTLELVSPVCPPQKPLKELSRPAEARAEACEALLRAAESVPRIEYRPDIPCRDLRAVPAEPEDEAAELAARLPIEKCIGLVIGESEEGNESALGAASPSVPGSAGETSRCALEDGIANIVLADGPAGLRLNQHYYAVDGKPRIPTFLESLENGFFSEGEKTEGQIRYQFTTAFPVGTLLAQTWDMPLLERVGAMIADEMLEFGVHLWLAPGMNLHRNPLCGRNFEYYSEDPLVSGACAAAVTRGVQSRPGVGTTIKHFACNNREDNRMASDSVVPERALRELYLRGFGIAIRESEPFAVMTSYNLINGVHAANSRDLCMTAARAEFGHKGLIMTDWTTTNHDDSCTASGCMRAGNDLIMPGMRQDHRNIREELESGALDPADVRACAARVIRVILRSGAYEE